MSIMTMLIFTITLNPVFAVCVPDRINYDDDSCKPSFAILNLDLAKQQIEKINEKYYYVSIPLPQNSKPDKINFHDVEFSSPYTHLPPRYTYSDIIFSDESEETLSVLFDYPAFSKHVNPQAGLVETNDGIRFLVSMDLKELSPLKQYKSGVSINEIQCKENFVLIQKYDGTPACVNPESLTKLIERGWAKENVIPTSEYVITKDNVTYGSSYQIVGGLINEIHYNEDSNSLIVSLSESGKGYLQILIQNGVLHSPREASFTYSVLIDGEEIMFENLSPVLLKIPFEKGAKMIEIIGAYRV